MHLFLFFFGRFSRCAVLSIAPPDEVCQVASLRVEDTLLVFETHIRLDFVGVFVEGNRLQTDAIGQVTW